MNSSHLRKNGVFVSHSKHKPSSTKHTMCQLHTDGMNTKHI